MTAIIVDCTSKGKLIFAADRRETEGDNKAKSVMPKVIRHKNGMLMGAAGDSDICDYLMYGLNYPKIDIDPILYVYHKLQPFIYNTLNRKNWLECAANIVLVGVKGRVFSISIGKDDKEDRVAGVMPTMIAVPCAIGSAGQITLAAYKAIQVTDIEHGLGKQFIKDNLVTAIGIAASINTSIDNEVDIVQEK